MITCARGVAGTLATLALATVLTACSGGKPAGVVTVTVPPSPGSSAPATAGASPSGASAAATAGSQTALPGTCDDLLTDYSVAQAANGGYTLGGRTGFIVGTADSGIGRLANINCRYGVTGSGDTAKRKVEIGVSLYSTAAQANARVSATVADYTAHGAASAPATVDGQQGQLLTGGSGTDYADPTLVVADGQRTIAVTVTSQLGTGTALTTAATRIADLAAQKTAP